MKSTMQAPPLLISTLLKYGTTVHGRSEVRTWTGNGARVTTYAEVGKQAAQLANALRQLGIDGDQRVATFMWNNAEHLTAYLAVPSMGAVLHALNIRLFGEQLAYTANHGGSEIVIVDNTLAEPFSKLLGHLPKIRHVIVSGEISDEVRDALAAPEHVEKVHDYAELLAGQPDTFDWPEDIDENDASSLCYTSGTTGNPKGVAYSHRSNYIHALSTGLTLGFTAHDRLLIVVPLFHANAWGFPYIAMLSGASLVMPDRYLQAEPLAAMIQSEKVTGGAGVPTIWNDLLRYIDSNEVDTSSVRRMMVGGSAAPMSMLKAYQDKHNIEIISGWGMTETSPVGSLAIPPSYAEPGTEEYWRYRVAAGRLLPGFEGRLIGPDGSEQPKDGESVGELEVRGAWITASYLNTESDSEADVADRASKFAEGGWFRTGDVGAVTADGFLYLTDRSKDVIKSGGEWISSVELENELMAHEDVVEASVVGIPDDKWGERPLANVVVREGATLTPEELRTFLADKIARWQLPDKWAFIDEVPKTSVGKFDKKVLRQRYADGELEVQTAAKD
ncbi:long-chain fatty acid--CoA ligase [Calidifontibacter sp. DB0510]|uniref:Long-chain fatty acid--CoA ligase n=1 Tax=Metallococcus carri TaxID=1656884 RepID=A0A967B8L6_9MICO|nr:long-chain fatty acid--CoA ligase [Metallococcus carri]NHN56801.1 long-chain fatty acid--CoA ligase [Metallococcus carri]NOP37822.1 long-chain fatty acid--CoA ligase [Calidifontibacter sp. DB2511S]